MWRPSFAGEYVIGGLIQRKYHVSWLLFWASIGIVAGTHSVLYVTGFTGLEWLVLGVLLLLLGATKRTSIGVLLTITGAVCIGLYSGGNQLLSHYGLEQFIQSDVSLTGRVIEDPSFDAEGDVRFRLKDVRINDTRYDGVVWVGAAGNSHLKRSDDVTVRGKLEKGFGTIPAAIYRAQVLSIERSDYADVARDTRDWFAEGIRDGIEEPESSLGAGFLLGQKTTLPEKLDQELRLLGLTHIVVASGYNLSILVRYGRRIFSKVSRFAGVALSAFMVFGFANITGFSPSMSRAALITGLSLLAWYYGRKIHPLVLLAVSAAITVIVNPVYAWGDIGWLLSFTSFVGVIMLSPLIHAYLWGDKKPGVVRQVFIETTSAQLVTLPIIAFVFGQYSPLALLANVLILPFIPAAMLLTFIAGISGILGFLVPVLAWPAQTLLRYMTVVVDKLAIHPLADSSFDVGIEMVFVMYAVIICLMVFLWRRTGLEFREYNVIE